jgi:hypothetical protein
VAEAVAGAKAGRQAEVELRRRHSVLGKKNSENA